MGRKGGKEEEDEKETVTGLPHQAEADAEGQNPTCCSGVRVPLTYECMPRLPCFPPTYECMPRLVYEHPLPVGLPHGHEQLRGGRPSQLHGVEDAEGQQRDGQRAQVDAQLEEEGEGGEEGEGRGGVGEAPLLGGEAGSCHEAGRDGK